MNSEENKNEKAKTQAENAGNAGEVKKKKPVFLFRPENSSFSNTNSGSKKQGGNRPASNSGKSSRPSDGQRRTETETRRPIKANVPTTAEMYKETATDGPRKIEDTTDAVKKLKKQEEKERLEKAKKAEEERIAAENAKKAQEEAEKAAAIERENAKRAQEEAEKAAKAAEKEKAEKAEKAAKAEAPVKTEAPAKAAAPVKKSPVGEKTLSNLASTVKRPEVVKHGNVFADQAKKAAEKAEKKPNFVFSQKNLEEGQQNRPNYRSNSGAGVNQVRRQDGNRPYNRDGQGRPGQGGQGQGNRYQGNNRGGMGQNRPFNKDGAFDKDAASQNNRGGNRPASRPSRGGEGGPALSKADVHGNKKNVKTDRDRGNYDRDGKKAENFKNLSREHENKKTVKAQEEVIKMIVLPEVITMKDLADKMKQKPADLIKKLFMQGKMMTLNSELSYEEAEAIALEYDILCEKEVQIDVIEQLLMEAEEDEKDMVKRPPVVCVMGHVDHGKTSLLDAIRSTNVTAREAGGITQHIGAYMVECKGEKITFLDTPGHEAFTAMRMRGAMATDIAVLVIAADDGVKPQTVEAINHAKAAGVDVIVAVNKIDKPTANVEKVKQELTEYGLIAEDWGGDTVFVPVSAKTGEGIDSLLEMILLVTEVKELKANPNREMRGLVIEAKLDKGRGPVATVLVQKGTMKVGDFISCGSFYGRVRAMNDANGTSMKTALPSTPVEILGLNGVPNAGEVCIGHKNEKDARSYADTFIAEEKKKMLAETKKHLTMDSLFAEIQAGNIKELPIVVKADVQGSVEAVCGSLRKLSNEEVTVKIIHSGVGAINESDVSLASASNAIIIGFNTRPDTQAKQLAESENVDLQLYRVIYQAIDAVEAAMKGMLAPVYEERVIGHAEVRMTFKASGVGVIAGSYVLDGTLERGCSIRAYRGDEMLYDGPLVSLKRFKDDVKEVREGFECGVVLEKFNDIMEGDRLEGYKMVQVERQ